MRLLGAEGEGSISPGRRAQQVETLTQLFAGVEDVLALRQPLSTSAAASIGSSDQTPYKESSAAYPPGCYLESGTLWYNAHATTQAIAAP